MLTHATLRAKGSMLDLTPKQRHHRGCVTTWQGQNAVGGTPVPTSPFQTVM